MWYILRLESRLQPVRRRPDPRFNQDSVAVLEHDSSASPSSNAIAHTTDVNVFIAEKKTFVILIQSMWYILRLESRLQPVRYVTSHGLVLNLRLYHFHYAIPNSQGRISREAFQV
jgi:hypothetical protein